MATPPTPSIPVREWSLSALLDDQLHDRLNFSLSDDQVGVLSALITGFSMVLLTDLVFRLVVRAAHDRVSTYHLLRNRLILRAASPLYWLSSPSRRAQTVPTPVSRKAYKPSPTAQTGQGAQQQAGAPSRFPRWRRVAIVAAGLLLTIAQLLLIFLATNRKEPYTIDMRSMPALALRSAPGSYKMPREHISCASHALFAKPGFVSRAEIMLCTDFFPVSVPDGNVELSLEKAVVALDVSANSSEFSYSIMTPRFHLSYSQEVSFLLNNGLHFKSKVSMTINETRDVMNALFEARRHTFSLTYMPVNDSGGTERQVLVYELDLNAFDLPMGYLPDGMNATGLLDSATFSTISYAWNHHLSSIIRGQLVLTGRAEAQEHTDGKRFLHDEPYVLVESERPWLSLASCIAMCVALCVVWAFVAAFLSWGSAVDHSIVWEHLFADAATASAGGSSSMATCSISDFSELPNVKVDLSRPCVSQHNADVSLDSELPSASDAILPDLLTGLEAYEVPKPM